MPDVYNGIFKDAQKYIKANSKYNPFIYKDTPQEQNKFPLVIIKQIDDPLYDENLDKTDQRFNLVYEIEIYTINKENIARQTITEELVKLVNDVFDIKYGFTRKTNNPIPNIDLNVDRRHMRFEAKIDENNIIYRR